MQSLIAEERPEHETERPRAEEALPTQVKKDLLSGTSVLGAGVMVERGCSFLANILAARLGGVSNFGAYALALSTANNISAYAAGGIGSTAIRFSGEHPIGSSSYPVLAKALAIISTVSAVLAALVLWLGAAPISGLLKKQSLTGTLRWAALSAAGIILLECCRGFLVGQRRIKAILLLSGLVGAGYLAFLPTLACLGPTAMVCSQSAVTLGAVMICLLCRRSLGLESPVTVESREPLRPLLRQVWSFGLMQLTGLIGMNAAGWWLTSLIARSDPTLVQMGFFAVSHQLRNMVALAPSLLNEGSLAVMASEQGRVKKTPDNVMAVCAYACTFASLVLAGVGMVAAPWGLALLYGSHYAGARAVTAIALATAVVHMGSAPISARLSIVSIRSTGLINTVWALFVAIVATLMLLHGGNAAKGASVYLAGHLLVALLQIRSLNKRGCIPKGTISCFSLGVVGALGMALLACWRESQPQQAQVWISLLMCFILGATTLALAALGRHRQWLPSRKGMRDLISHRLPALRLAARRQPARERR